MIYLKIIYKNIKFKYFINIRVIYLFFAHPKITNKTDKNSNYICNSTWYH